MLWEAWDGGVEAIRCQWPSVLPGSGVSPSSGIKKGRASVQVGVWGVLWTRLGSNWAWDARHKLVSHYVHVFQ